MDTLSRELKEEYYRVLSQKANDESTFFKLQIHRFILIRYAEGASIKMICEELDALEEPRHRGSVRFIIRRYEMIWGFRVYTHKELHKR